MYFIFAHVHRNQFNSRILNYLCFLLTRKSQIYDFWSTLSNCALTLLKFTTQQQGVYKLVMLSQNHPYTFDLITVVFSP